MSVPVKGKRVTVVGAANVDIGGKSFGELIQRDSNPGTVRISLGGVGRNIAHNASLLGLEVNFITALGGDAYAAMIKDSCRELGIDLSGSIFPGGQMTSTYMFLSGPDGDMELALSDMEIYSELRPELIAPGMERISGSALVIIDTNIPRESVEYIARHCEAPVFADPVSAAKAVKLSGVLGRMHTVKPNLIEAEVLSGIKISSRRDLERAAGVMLGRGLRRVFISLREEGVFAAEEGKSLIVPSVGTLVKNSTGAGDAMMSALAWAFFEDMELEETAIASQAAASVAMRSEETINPLMSVSALRERMPRGKV